MNAPVCPVSRNQLPTGTRSGWPTRLPSIPIATDLPSLIRSVNIMNDILRTITTSLTVNNVWEPQYGNLYIISPYPAWSQSEATLKEGYVYYKAKGQEPDKDQRAYVQRTEEVKFTNTQQGDDPTFLWRLKKDFDSEYGDSKGTRPFAEDFFERIVNVKWDAGLAVEFGNKDGGPPGDSDNLYNKQTAAAPEPEPVG